MKKTYLLLLAALCLLLFVLIHIWCQQQLEYDKTALMVGNGVLATLGLISYFMLQKKMKSDRPQVFVNGVYGSTLLRLMVCMTGISLYLYFNQGHLHKPTIFALMGIYLIYTMLETVILSKIAKK